MLDADLTGLSASRHTQASERGYFSGAAFAWQIAERDWSALRDDRWVAIVPKAPRCARRTQTLLLRWRTDSKPMQYATFVHSLLDQDWHTIPALYDERYDPGKVILGLLKALCEPASK